LHVGTEQIIAGNGASEIIALILNVWRPRKLLIPVPAYSEYAACAKRLGIQVIFFPLPAKDNFQLAPDALCAVMQDTEVELLFLCNPNNPTSTLLEIDALHALVSTAQRKNIKVVIDEAFIELTAEGNRNSFVDALKQYPNLFIIRAFTKIFALPGLRLGYGLGPEQVIARMWEEKLPWSVNTFACRLGRLLTTEKAYLQRTAAWLAEERTWFHAQLARLGVFRIFPPASNFMLVEILDRNFTAGSLRQKLACHGILIRDAGNFTCLNERFVRFAIKDRESNLRFLRTLASVLNLTVKF
jgi:threonine-phosphate decarboxylase